MDSAIAPDRHSASAERVDSSSVLGGSGSAGSQRASNRRLRERRLDVGSAAGTRAAAGLRVRHDRSRTGAAQRQNTSERRNACGCARSSRESPAGGHGFRVPSVGKASTTAMMSDVRRPPPRPRWPRRWAHGHSTDLAAQKQPQSRPAAHCARL